MKSKYTWFPTLLLVIAALSGSAGAVAQTTPSTSLNAGSSTPRLTNHLSKKEYDELLARKALWKRQAPEWAAIREKFFALQKRRFGVAQFSDEEYKLHVAALQALYEKVMALKQESSDSGYDWDITVATELRHFGVVEGRFAWIDNLYERVQPKTLVDPKTHIKYELNSDGRHIQAIGIRGEVLWSHEAFDDYGLVPYRFAKPVITVFRLSAGSKEEFAAGKKRVAQSAVTFSEVREFGFRERDDYSKRFLEITFNSSQFGDIDANTGEFTFEGQN